VKTWLEHPIRYAYHSARFPQDSGDGRGRFAGCLPISTRCDSSLVPVTTESPSAKPVVSIVKIKGGSIAAAVEEAIHLLGGIEAVTSGKERIMLKPNLVANDPRITTKPEVIRALARLMQQAGKTVLIGEGSAAASGFNVRDDTLYRLKNPDKLRLCSSLFSRAWVMPSWRAR